MTDKKITLAALFLRISLGWIMLYSGITKILDSTWTAKGFLLHAGTFPDFYAWFASDTNLLWVNPLNAWGMTLIGIALVIGVAIRPAAWAGVILMILYYFPHVQFPKTPNGFIVEEHVVYAAAFILIATLPQAHRFGLSKFLKQTYLGRMPIIKNII